MANLTKVEIQLSYSCKNNKEIKKVLESYDKCQDFWKSAKIIKSFDDGSINSKSYLN